MRALADGVRIDLPELLESVEAQFLRQPRHRRRRHLRAPGKLAHRKQRDILRMIQQPLRRRPELPRKPVEIRQQPIVNILRAHDGMLAGLTDFVQQVFHMKLMWIICCGMMLLASS
jgi:hypothetical protein